MSDTEKIVNVYATTTHDTQYVVEIRENNSWKPLSNAGKGSFAGMYDLAKRIAQSKMQATIVSFIPKSRTKNNRHSDILLTIDAGAREATLIRTLTHEEAEELTRKVQKALQGF